jgi:hypothetical protein
MTTFWTVSGDAADPRRLAEFWKLALGYIDEPGYDFADGAALIDPHGVLPPISFLKVPEGKTAKNRLHLDVRVAGGSPGDEVLCEQRIRDKAAELVAAGATVVDEYAFDGVLDHIVMQDPEGNEFCVASRPGA